MFPVVNFLKCVVTEVILFSIVAFKNWRESCGCNKHVGWAYIVFWSEPSVGDETAVNASLVTDVQDNLINLYYKTVCLYDLSCRTC